VLGVIAGGFACDPSVPVAVKTVTPSSGVVLSTPRNTRTVAADANVARVVGVQVGAQRLVGAAVVAGREADRVVRGARPAVTDDDQVVLRET
jgi:hypothetical protein